MPSWSSFALAFLTRSDCLLAYSGLSTSTSCGSFCAKEHASIRLLATSAHAVSSSAILEIRRANSLRKPRGPGMKCPACGAEMHLIKVAPDKPMMVGGYEEHTFECSGCHDQVRRRVFIPRPIEPLTNAQMPRLPPTRLKSLVDGTVPKSAWSRALEAVARVNAMYVGGALFAIGLAGSMVTWGQDQKGPMGDRGPPGPKAAQANPVRRGRVRTVGTIRSNCTNGGGGWK